MAEPADAAALASTEAFIDDWLRRQQIENSLIAAVDRDPETPRRWFVRVTGEEKDVFTIRFHLKQRTLAYETYVMPAPEENHAQFYAHLLERNLHLFGGAFAIGEEGAIFLRGATNNELIASGDGAAEDELDRVLGSMYIWVEQYFRPALRIGYASKFS